MRFDGVVTSALPRRSTASPEAMGAGATSQRPPLIPEQPRGATSPFRMFGAGLRNSTRRVDRALPDSSQDPIHYRPGRSSISVGCCIW